MYGAKRASTTSPGPLPRCPGVVPGGVPGVVLGVVPGAVPGPVPGPVPAPRSGASFTDSPPPTAPLSANAAPPATRTTAVAPIAIEPRPTVRRRRYLRLIICLPCVRSCVVYGGTLASGWGTHDQICGMRQI